jgi:hypothetical protein
VSKLQEMLAGLKGICIIQLSIVSKSKNETDMIKVKTDDEKNSAGEDRKGEKGHLQEFVINGDGTVDVAWLEPSAGPLVLAVWQSLENHSIPIELGTGHLFCG